MESNNKKISLKESETKMTNVRNLSPWIKKALSIWAVSGIIIILYSMFYGYFTPAVHAAIFLMFTISIIFILYKPRKEPVKEEIDIIPIYDLIATILTILIFLYVIISWDEMVYRTAKPITMDIICAYVCILLLLEAARRTIGNILPIIALVFTCYAFWGYFIPGLLYYRGTTIGRYAAIQFLTLEGIFGTATQIGARTILIFLLFGSFLQVSGAGELLLKMSLSLAGKAIGGPSKVAVIGSALMSMISGSASANVATTGQFTIPLMKKNGFSPRLAGAVEAVASCGGTITPPIMGAGAFIMAEALGISYSTIALAAVIPALLYYIGVYTSIHFEAKKIGLKGLSKEQIPRFLPLLKEGIHVIIPIIFLIYLIAIYFPINRAALYSIILLVICSLFQKKTRMSLAQIYQGLEKGMFGIATFGGLSGAVGVIIGALSLTGLGPKLASAIIAFGSAYFWLALFLAMAICIILGMGLPATPAYIVAGAVVAPGLVGLGLEPLASHMFIFHFASLAQITPPVAIAAYVGANIAGSDPLKTALTAVRLGLVALIIPFMFIRAPELLLQGDAVLILVSVITAIIGVFATAVGTCGYFYTNLSMPIRILLIIGGICLIDPAMITNYIGISLILVTFLMLFIQNKKSKSVSF